MVFRREYAV